MDNMNMSNKMKGSEKKRSKYFYLLSCFYPYGRYSHQNPQKPQVPKAPKETEEAKLTKITSDDHYTDDNNNIDRLSSLPECLLISILSLLPIKSAMSTSLLSRQWRLLWTQVTRLSLSYIHFRDTNDFEKGEDAQKVLIVLGHILRQLTSPKLDTFILDMCIWNTIDIHQYGVLLQSWFPIICSRNPVHVVISHWGFLRPLNFVLPMCVFQCKSLVSLELNSKCDYKLPDDGIITLPNLIKLRIFIYSSSECAFVTTLVKSCPVLEELFFLGLLDANNNRLGISGPNLRCLKLFMTNVRYSIHAPKLVSFYTWSGAYPSYTYESDRMSNLGNANASLTSVTYLVATCGWTDLRPLLRHCPNLVVLRWHLVSQDPVSAKSEDIKFWDVPTCFVRALKSIAIHELEATMDELNFLKYVLSSASSLEVVKVRLAAKFKSSKGFEFSEELLSCPRVNSNCVVEFSIFP